MVQARGLAIRKCALALTVGFGLGLAGNAHAVSYSALYAFGDSLSDIGNDLIVTGGLVPAPTYYTDGSHFGRFTNGLNYLDGLSSALGLSLAPSLLGGTDYAFGGARTTYVNPGLPPTARSFNQQIAAYDAGHASADPNALYVLWIGANDMADATSAAATGNATAIDSAVSTAMTGISGAITDLAGKGAKHFLVGNVPDLSLVPQVRARNNPGLNFLANLASVSFNSALAGTLGAGAFSSLDIRRLDAFAALNSVLANPASYGFTNATGSCYSGEVDGTTLPAGSSGTPTVCANPSQYVFWDYEHPTAALNSVLAANALAAVVPEPPVWSLLLLGVAVTAAARRPWRAAFTGQAQS